MNQLTPTYRAFYWRTELNTFIQSFWHLTFFLNNDLVKEAYIQEQERKNAISLKNLLNGVDTLTDEHTEGGDEIPGWEMHWVSMHRQDIVLNLSEAQEVVNRQAVVLTTTFIEVIIKDFAQCLFYRYPKTMTAFIGSNETKGYVKLERISNLDELNELWGDLSKEAINKFSNGGTKDLFDKLDKLIPDADLRNQLGKEINVLIELRNKIVHEAHKPIVGIDGVRAILDTCVALLYQLGNYAVEHDLPLDFQKAITTEGIPASE
jgi:hypothetical protein